MISRVILTLIVRFNSPHFICTYSVVAGFGQKTADFTFTAIPAVTLPLEIEEQGDLGEWMHQFSQSFIIIPSGHSCFETYQIRRPASLVGHDKNPHPDFVLSSLTGRDTCPRFWTSRTFVPATSSRFCPGYFGSEDNRPLHFFLPGASS